MGCMLELEDFRFKDRFVGLTDMQLQSALQAVNAQFSGVYTLWSLLPPEQAKVKRELCVNYLVAWKLAMLYPEAALDAGGSGSMPLKSKKVGPISIAYKDMVRRAGSGVMEMLTTNQYGLEALMMIQSAPENYILVR